MARAFAALALLLLAAAPAVAADVYATPAEICTNHPALRAQAGKSAILVDRGKDVVANFTLAQLRAAWAQTGKPNAAWLVTARSNIPGWGFVIWLPSDYLATGQRADSPAAKRCIMMIEREAGYIRRGRQSDPGTVIMDNRGWLPDPHAGETWGRR